MKNFTLLSLLTTSVLLIFLSITNATASGMKCGDGKCGSAMMMEPDDANKTLPQDTNTTKKSQK